MNTPQIIRESREVEITLRGLVRSVPIVRCNGGAWFANATIVCAFKTGTKLHTLNHPIVDEVKPGQFAFRRRQVVANRNCSPFAYIDDVAANSKWNREPAAVSA